MLTSENGTDLDRVATFEVGSQSDRHLLQDLNFHPRKPSSLLFPHRRRIIILIRRRRMQIFRGLIAIARSSGDESERGKRRQRGRRGGR